MTNTSDPTLSQQLTVVKYLANGRALGFVQAAVPELHADQILHIAESHGYPDVDTLAQAQATIERQIDESAQQIQPSRVDEQTVVGRIPADGSTRDTRDTNRVTGNESPPADPTTLTKPDEIRVLLNTAKQSSSKRIQRKADQIFDQVGQLRELVNADQAKAAERAAREQEKQAARDEVRRLEEQLKAAKAKARGHTRPTGSSSTSGRAQTASQARDARKVILDTHGVTTADVRAWARANGEECPDKGVLPLHVLEAYDAAHTATTKGTNAA